jgi:diguanylate cyclase (GGDEF)-like protein/PAS domain S-box-containing protein
MSSNVMVEGSVLRPVQVALGRMSVGEAHATSRRPCCVLGAGQATVAVLVVAFGEITLKTTADDRAYYVPAAALAALALITIVLMPRSGVWSLLASVATTSLLLAVVAASVPQAGDELPIVLASVLLAVFIGHYLPPRHVVGQLGFLICAYWIVMELRPSLLSPIDVLVAAGVLIMVAGVVAALSSSERRNRMLVGSSPDAVLALDGRGIVTWASPTVTTIGGWSPAELTGSPWDHLIHPGDRMLLVEQPSDSDGGTEPSTTRTLPVVRFRTRSGDYRWVSVTVILAPDRLERRPGCVAMIKDVDDLVAARETAWDERCRLHATLDALLDPHALLQPERDVNGHIVDFVFVDANAAACTFNGMTYSELVGTRLLDLYPDPMVADLFAAYCQVVKTGTPATFDDWTYPVGVGKYFDIRAVRVDGCISQTWRDATDRHTAAEALASSEEQFRLLAENTLDVILRARAGRFVWISPSIADALGWLPGDIVGRDHYQLVLDEDWPVLDDAIAALEAGSPAVFRVRARAKDMTYHWVECHAKPYRDSTGRDDGAAVTLRTVDLEVANEQRLDWQAHHDELTGLLNRKAALVELGAGRGRSPRLPGSDTAVLFCDVDSFKAINDCYGHAVGDQVLKAIADRVTATVRARDLVARVGGDELLIALAGVHGMDEAKEKAEAIRRCVAEPISTTAGAITATLSIGLTLALPGECTDESIARADAALYRAKQAGRNCVTRIVEHGSKVPFPQAL